MTGFDIPHEFSSYEQLDLQLRTERQQAEQAFRTAAAGDPKLARRQQQLSAQLGLQSTSLEPKVLEQLAREDNMRRMAEDHRFPALSAAVRRESFARISADDLEHLREVESTFGWLRANWRNGRNTYERGVSGTMWAAEGLSREEVLDRAAKIPLRGVENSGFFGFLGDATEVLGQWASMLSTSAMVAATAAAPVAAVSGPGAPISGGAVFAKTFAATSLLQAAMMEGGNAYIEYMEAGYDPESAKAAALGVGLLGGAAEFAGARLVAAPFRGLGRKLLGKGAAAAVTQTTTSKAWTTFGKQYLKAIGGEVGTEMFQEAVQMAGEEYARMRTDPRMAGYLETNQGRQEVWDRMLGIAEKTAKAMLLLGLPGPVANLYVDSRRAVSTEAQKTFLGKLATGAAESELRKEAPAQFRALVAEMTDESVPELFVTKAALRQTIDKLEADATAAGTESVQDTLAKALPDVAAALSGTGEDVVIKTADFATHLAGTRLGEALAPHLRAEQGALSAAEMDRYAPQLEAEAERLKETFKENAAELKEHRKQLTALRKRVSDEVVAAGRPLAEARLAARMLSSFVSTNAARLQVENEDGTTRRMTVAEFDEMYRLSTVQSGEQATGEKYWRVKYKAGKTTPRYGTPQKGASSFLGVHYSYQPRESLDANRYGQGMRGRESARVQGDPVLSKRAHFYYDRDGTGIEPESGVGNVAHVVQLDNIYDTEKDELGIVARVGTRDPNKFERAIVRAGFDGYSSPNALYDQGMIVVIGKKHNAIPVRRQPGVYRQAKEAEPKKAAKGKKQTARTRARNFGDIGLSALTRGRQVPPEVVEAAGLASARALQKEMTQRDGAAPDNRPLKEALQGRLLAALKAAKLPAKPLDKMDQGTFEYLVQAMTADATLLLSEPGGQQAVGWYDETVRTAMAVVAEVFPELETDSRARFAFTYALAVTSNGLKVDKNFEMAAVVYRYWRENKRMPTDGTGVVGKQGQPMIDAFTTWNEFVDRLGIDGFETLLTTQATVSDLAKAGIVVGDENASTMVYGAAMLGPKIGNGFFMNLRGVFTQLTMDRWLYRTFARHFGGLIEVDPATVRKHRKLVQLAWDAADKTAVVTFSKKRTVNKQTVYEDRQVNLLELTELKKRASAAEVGETIARMSVDPKFRDAINEIPGGAVLRRAANLYAKSVNGEIERPKNGTQRNWIRAIVAESMRRVKEAQPELAALTVADFQAVLWYGEKLLYESGRKKRAAEASTEYSEDEKPDYANAAVKLARAEGVSEDRINEAKQRAADAHRAAVESAGDDGPGDVDGAGGIPTAQPEPPLAGLESVVVVDGQQVQFGPDERARAAAREYAERAGIDYQPPRAFVPVDVERAKRIAGAFDEMKHEPDNPEVAAAYEALIEETLAQWQVIKETGLVVEFITGADPYGNPRNAILDVVENNHLWVYPTDAGFGGSESANVDISGNPLLRLVEGETISGRPVRVNDIFRIVHDYFGHVKEGVGFRARGEENAWQQHMAMYSPLARKALTVETRGQNSWVNFGPFAEANRTADGATTQYAPQKIGLLPDWVVNEGYQGGGKFRQTRGPVTETPEFKAWFGDSKVVDKDGKPLVVYHATTADFTEFDRGAKGVFRYGDAPDSGGIFFGTDPESVGYYSEGSRGQEKGARTIPAYLSLRNPAQIEGGLSLADQSKALLKAAAAGYDGARIGSNQWVAFRPEQIKSATGNDGAFDPRDPSILRQTRDAEPEAMVNIGLNVGSEQGITPEQVIAALQARGLTVSRWEVQQSNTESTVVAALDRELTQEEGDAISVELQQEAIAVRRRDGTGVLFGPKAAEWGPYNPEYFLMFGGRRASEVDAERAAEAATEAARAAEGEPEARGEFDPARLTIGLSADADTSTWLHELGHYFLEVYERMTLLDGVDPATREDFAKLLNWFGVTEQQWRGFGLEQKRKYHEQFAYNFELYLFDNKAPAPELRSMFRRFADWLKLVYRELTRDPRRAYFRETGEELPELTAEVREVIDRMLVSEDTMRAAQAVYGAMPLFQTKAEFIAAGFDGDQWDELQELQARADADAIDDLTRRSLRDMKWQRNARGRVLSKMQAEAKELRNEMRDDVAAEVEQQPVYRLLSWMRGKDGLADPEGQGRRRLNRAAVEALFPFDDTRAKYEAAWAPFLSNEGMSPDAAAQLHGFTTDAMIDAVAQAPALEEAIEKRIDERMLAEHGELSDPKKIEEAVDAALHTQVRARFVATELAAITQGLTPVRVMLAAAKLAAEMAIGSQQVRKLQARWHTVAEQRAARDAFRYMREGKAEQAILAKRQQLRHGQLAVAAVAAREDVESSLRKFRRFYKADDKLGKTREIGLVQAARAILAAFEIGGTKQQRAMMLTRSEEFLAQLKAYDPPMYDEVRVLIDDATANKKNFRDLSYDEFRLLRDTVEAIWFESKRRKQIVVNGRKVAIEDAQAEMQAQIETLTEPTAVAPGMKRAPAARDKVIRAVQGLRSAMLRAESEFDLIDAGNEKSPWTTYLFRPVQKAIDAYRVDRTKFVKKFVALLESVEMKPGKIDAPEIGYEFGHGNNGLGIAELLGAMLHMGNKSNASKLLVGREWTDMAAAFDEDGNLNTGMWDALMERLEREGIVTKQHWDFVHSVWRLMDEIKPLTQEAHKELYGYYFTEVKPWKVKTSFGEYDGGYVPAKVDTFIDPQARIHESVEQLEADARYAHPAVGKGFSIKRVEEYRRPLSIDVRLISRHIDETTRFAHVQPAIRDALSLLRSQELRDAVALYDPVLIDGMILPWLQRAARQTVQERGMNPTVDNFWRAVRARTGMATMFANVSNALQQVTGWFPAMLKVKPSFLLGGLKRYLGAPKATTAAVADLSPFMAERLQSQVFDMKERMDEIVLHPSRFQKAQAWSTRNAYFLQSAFQNLVDVTTWAGAHEQALAEKKSPEDAVAIADAAVRLTQGGTAPEQVARFETGTAFTRLWTQFQGYFNMLANLNRTEMLKVARQMGWAGSGKLFGVYVLGFAAPMLVADAIARGFSGEFDDEDDDGYGDEFLAWLFGGQARGALALLPYGGNVAVVALNSWNNKPYDDRMMTSPSISALESATVGVFRAAVAAFDPERDISGKNVRDVLTLLTLYTGLPLATLGRPVGYGIDVATGRVEPYNAADAARGFVTGRAAEGTR